MDSLRQYWWIVVIVIGTGGWIARAEMSHTDTDKMEPEVQAIKEYIMEQQVERRAAKEAKKASDANLHALCEAGRLDNVYCCSRFVDTCDEP